MVFRKIHSFFFSRKGVQLAPTTIIYIIVAIGAVILMVFAVYMIKSKIFG